MMILLVLPTAVFDKLKLLVFDSAGGFFSSAVFELNPQVLGAE